MWCGLVDGDAIRVRNRRLLSDRQHECDRVSDRRLLPCARAGQLYAVSDWRVLQFDRSICLRALHGWDVLLVVGPECAVRQLQRRLPLPDRFEWVDTGAMPGDDILPGRQSLAHCVSSVVLLRQRGHAYACSMFSGIVLRCRRSVGAEWHVRQRPLLRDGLEHGDAESLHGRRVLLDVGSERAHRQLQWGILLRRGLVNVNAVRVPRWSLLSDWQRECERLSDRCLLSG